MAGIITKGEGSTPTKVKKSSTQPHKPEAIRLILAKNVKFYRNQLGLTQNQLAEESGLTLATINTLEGGRMWISDKSVTRLSKALHVEIFQLFISYQLAPALITPKKKTELLKIWQKTKLQLDALTLNLDTVFRESLSETKE